jgi:endo-1,4-beta-xylanase
MNDKPSRREFLQRTAATAGAMVIAPIAKSLDLHSSESKQAASVEPLQEAATRKGLLYGGAVEQIHLQREADFAHLFGRQCGILVPEGALKWGSLRPSPDRFDFEGADYLLNFALQNQMKMRGHALLAHDTVPSWFASYANPRNAKELLVNHITTVAGRYRDKMHSWDVVNEAILPGDHRSDGLRNSEWLRLLGPEHIEIAFHAAAQADPSALLVWNENWMEEENTDGDNRRAAFLRHLKDLRSRSVPIHAVGLQSHLIGKHKDIIAGAGFQRFLQEVVEMGLKILVTELDVRDYDFPQDFQTRDSMVADVYHKYLTAVLQHKSVLAVLTWGLSDRHTWVSRFTTPRADGIAMRPLPFDPELNPTAVYTSMMSAFDQAPHR